MSHYVDTDSLCEELTVAELGERAAEIHSALILPTGLCRAIDAEIPRMVNFSRLIDLDERNSS